MRDASSHRRKVAVEAPKCVTNTRAGSNPVIEQKSRFVLSEMQSTQSSGRRLAKILEKRALMPGLHKCGKRMGTIS
jgi:hypothetical protein